MANRRQVLVSGAALTGAALLPVSLQATVSELVAPGVELFVFDKRFENAVALAQQAEQQGIPLAETSGDLMELWYDQLSLQWKELPMTLSGVTTARALFVLETLAADHRMQVVHRVGHSELTDAQYAPVGDTALVSWVIAPRIKQEA